MKFEVTHPKIWKKLAEKNIPMKHKIKIYEKLGGAYRLGEDAGEQVFNKMTELLKHKIKEDNACDTCGMQGMNIAEEDNNPPQFITVPKKFTDGDKEVNSGEYTFYSKDGDGCVYQTKNDSVTFTPEELDKYMDQGLVNKNDYVDASTDTSFAPAYNPLHESLIDQIYDALMKIPGFNKLGMDQQGTISMAVQKLFKSAGLRENKQRLIETKFYAFWNGKKIEIDGTSLWDAKQKAIIKLGVPKSKIGLLAVVNAGEHDGGSFRFNESLKEEEDHEVSMAQSQLGNIIKYATELKQKIGTDEKNIPAWVQDHISNSENFIEQANGYSASNESMNERVISKKRRVMRNTYKNR